MPLLQTRLQCFTNHYLPDAGVGKKGKEQSSKAGNCSQMKTRSENKESLEICCEYINWKKSFIESILQKKKNHSCIILKSQTVIVTQLPAST